MSSRYECRQRNQRAREAGSGADWLLFLAWMAVVAIASGVRL
jgi:hypothetical protein